MSLLLYVCISVPADNIRDGDVILTFGSSPVLRGVLLHAATVKKRTFSLVVIDSIPLQEGVRTLAALSPFIQCTYSPMAGASRAMKDATRVLLGEFCYPSYHALPACY